MLVVVFGLLGGSSGTKGSTSSGPSLPANLTGMATGAGSFYFSDVTCALGDSSDDVQVIFTFDQNTCETEEQQISPPMGGRWRGVQFNGMLNVACSVAAGSAIVYVMYKNSGMLGQSMCDQMTHKGWIDDQASEQELLKAQQMEASSPAVS